MIIWVWNNCLTFATGLPGPALGKPCPRHTASIVVWCDCLMKRVPHTPERISSCEPSVYQMGRANQALSPPVMALTRVPWNTGTSSASYSEWIF